MNYLASQILVWPFSLKQPIFVDVYESSFFLLLLFFFNHLKSNMKWQALVVNLRVKIKQKTIAVSQTLGSQLWIYYNISAANDTNYLIWYLAVVKAAQRSLCSL